jgi:hypothetical protein
MPNCVKLRKLVGHYCGPGISQYVIAWFTILGPALLVKVIGRCDNVLGWVELFSLRSDIR